MKEITIDIWINNIKTLKSFGYTLKNNNKKSLIIVKQILSKYSKKDPNDWIINTNQYGKPFIENNSDQLHFNISHSNDFFCCAISKEENIGIDIEYTSKRRQWKEIAINYFHKEEIKFILKDSENKREHKFYEIWTKKEAYLKAIGIGLHVPLNSFNVLNENISTCQLTQKFETPENYIGAVSVKPKKIIKKIKFIYKNLS